MGRNNHVDMYALLKEAIGKKANECVKFLLTMDSVERALKKAGPLLVHAIESRNNEAALLLYEHCHKVELTEALVVAIKQQNVNMVELLLDKGADPNGNVLGEGKGGMPLALAIEMSDRHMVELLLKAGALTTLCCGLSGETMELPAIARAAVVHRHAMDINSPELAHEAGKIMGLIGLHTELVPRRA